jgi:hypothetical protein
MLDRFKGKVKCPVCGGAHSNPEMRQVKNDGLPKVMIRCEMFGTEFEYRKELLKK